MKLSFSLLVFLLSAFFFDVLSQELCDNGIDDDGDNFIDLNDEDCICKTVVPISLINNPSFEEMTCCPMENARLDCATGWIQASAPTTDYVHTCGGYLGNFRIPAVAPLPFPDGEGGVGFRDGEVQGGSNYKEYVGGCLTKPMEIGLFYRFDFFVGFQDNKFGSTEFSIAIFASELCSDIPFGNGSASIGCPANTNQFTQLGEQIVSGSDEWVNVVFEFEADKTYNNIVLGPACAANPNYQRNPYFYLDRLTIAESSEFGIPFESVSGSICDNDLILQTNAEAGSSYQWYRNGVAMAGETNSSLLLEALNDTEGKYLAIITDSTGCFKSQEYILRIPPYYSQDTVTICEDEVFSFGMDNLTSAGDYERTLRATDGCDSIIQLSFNVNHKSESFMRDTFCEGNLYSFLDIETSDPGIYQTFLPNAVGCDSTITIELASVEEGEDIIVQEKFIVNLGENLIIIPESYDPRYTVFQWTDDEENIISEELELYINQPTQSGEIKLEAYDKYGCYISKNISYTVNTNYEVYAPNIFSPDENGINDYFQFYTPLSVSEVISLSIFDRWGNQVFQEKSIDVSNGYRGWDGTFKGEIAPIGVYTYVIELSFIDGNEKTLAGNITLIR